MSDVQPESAPLYGVYPPEPDYARTDLSTPELIRSAITDELAAAANKDFLDAARNPEAKAKAQEKIDSLPEGAIAYRALLGGYIYHHAYSDKVNTAENFHDWIETAQAHRAVRSAVDGQEYTELNTPYLSRVMGTLSDTMGGDELAFETICADIQQFDDRTRHQVVDAIRRGLDLSGPQVAAFVAANLPPAQLDVLDDSVRAKLSLIRRIMPFDVRNAEKNAVQYLARAARHTENAQLVIPAVEQYFAGPYPEGLLRNTKQRPEYARLMSTLVMMSLENLRETDARCAAIYAFLLAQSGNMPRGIYSTGEGATPESAQPPVGAYIAIANKIRADTAAKTGHSSDKISLDGGDAQLPRAVKTIIGFAGDVVRDIKAYDTTKAEQFGGTLRCAELMTDRLQQYLEAKAGNPSTSEPVSAQTSGGNVAAIQGKGVSYHKRNKPGYGPMS